MRSWYEPLSLFQQETVLVESAGMSQWLNTRIAKNNGIASQIVYPYPASFIWQLYRAQQPDLPRISVLTENLDLSVTLFV